MDDLFESLKEQALTDGATVRFKEIVVDDPFQNIDEEAVLRRLLRFFGEEETSPLTPPSDAN